MIFYQLSRPAAYLFIKDKSKWKIDWLIPFILSVTLTALYLSLPIAKPLYGENGIIKELQGFLQILPGFYLAALAAIATFNKNDLDYHLPKPTPIIDVIVNGHETSINLTRRRMLSYLFGYLTFISLAIYLVTVLGSALSGSVNYLLDTNAIYPKALYVFAISLFFSQMIVVTIFGLYQLCDRIHQPEDLHSKSVK